MIGTPEGLAPFNMILIQMLQIMNCQGELRAQQQCRQ
jgi:hypothetical protein